MCSWMCIPLHVIKTGYCQQKQSLTASGSCKDTAVHCSKSHLLSTYTRIKQRTVAQPHTDTVSLYTLRMADEAGQHIVRENHVSQRLEKKKNQKHMAISGKCVSQSRKTETMI